MDFGATMFHESTTTDKNAYWGNGLSVWKYKIIKYTVTFFCVCARWCNKPNTAERNEWRRSFIPLYHAKVTILVNQSMFCSDFSSTVFVPFAVLGTPTEGYQKSGMVSYFGYHSQILTVETAIIFYRTVLLSGASHYCPWQAMRIFRDPILFCINLHIVDKDFFKSS